MSYLHCPTCACAYNVAREPACPRCGIRAGTPADPTDDVITAVEQLARAMARATPSQIASAEATLAARDAQLALPAPGAHAAPPPSVLRAVRAVLAPADDVSPPPTWLESIVARIPPAQQTSWRAILDAALVRLAPRLPAAPPPVTTRVVDRAVDRAAWSLRSIRSWGAARVRGPLVRARDAFAA
ncbi:MAG: hypothetical protein H0T89_36900 [Deltaproteobacteria bacterium]|nr:hypothetical protein [Deltaproteobacteria bacterium]MDQ3299064.1 hypothetical protein [Myxococcota bacterium]